MEKTNDFRFRYWIHPPRPDAQERLHMSGVTETITHTSYQDMMRQVAQIIHTRINVPGPVTVQMSPSGQAIDECHYDFIPNNPRITLIATIDNTCTGPSDLSSSFTSAEDLLPAIRSLHERLTALEEEAAL